MSKRTAGDVLIELLDRIGDANKIEKLLEPATLLHLLTAYGWKQEDVREELKSGKIPGELLLDLLAVEPNPDKLLAAAAVQPEEAGGIKGKFDQWMQKVNDETNAYNQKIAQDPDQQRKHIKMTGWILAISSLVIGLVGVGSLFVIDGLYTYQVGVLIVMPIMFVVGIIMAVTGKNIMK